MLSRLVLLAATLTSALAVPSLPLPLPPHLCTVKASGGDDAPALYKALNGCPIVKIPKDQVLSIRSPLNTTSLHNVYIDLRGTIKYYDDVPYWAQNAFFFEFQNSYTFWLLGGRNIILDGHGEGRIDGTGATWWAATATNKTIARPISLTIYQGKNVIVQGVRMYQSPMWFNLVHTSQDVLYTDMYLEAKAEGAITPKNSDGWDTYRSDRVIIKDSVINNNDDCVSFKPNSTNILVKNLDCSGSHGMSVGSLGQYPQYVDFVENILVQNVSLTNSSNSVRIKVWAGPDVGSGRVNNVTWDGLKLTNVEQALTFDQCYFSEAVCAEYPSRVNISNVHIKDVSGTTSGKHQSLTADIMCSPNAVCENIVVDNYNVTPPTKYGTATTVCENLTICGSSADQFKCTGKGTDLPCRA